MSSTIMPRDALKNLSFSIRIVNRLTKTSIAYCKQTEIVIKLFSMAIVLVIMSPVWNKVDQDNCGLLFTDLGSAMQFLKPGNGPSGGTWRCTICNKWLSKKSHGVRHMENLHMAPQWVTCNYCNRQFKNKHVLYNHAQRCVKKFEFQY